MGTREWNSQEYDRLSAPQHAWGVKVLERLHEKGIPARSLVLDAGCGTGRVTSEMLAKFRDVSVVGADLSSNMLLTARENLSSRFRDRVTLVRADLAQLPFAARFQAVFSTATFHWVKDHGQLFRSIWGALAPGGWLVAQCGGGPNLKQQRDRARRLQQRPEFVPYFAGWAEPWEYADETTTKKRLAEAGFVNVCVWLEEAPTELPDRETYRAFLANVTLQRVLERLPDAGLRQTFLDEVVEQTGGSWTLDYWRLNIDARKPE
jgi:trans-aconitate 2-methyltransferase